MEYKACLIKYITDYLKSLIQDKSKINIDITKLKKKISGLVAEEVDLMQLRRTFSNVWWIIEDDIVQLLDVFELRFEDYLNELKLNGEIIDKIFNDYLLNTRELSFDVQQCIGQTEYNPFRLRTDSRRIMLRKISVLRTFLKKI